MLFRIIVSLIHIGIDMSKAGYVVEIVNFGSGSGGGI
jgi:hypothetical protein